MPTLIDKQKELDQKRGELAAAFKAAQNEDGSWKEITPEQQTEFIQRNQEINTLADAVKSLSDLERTAQANEDAIKSSQRVNRTFEFGSGSREQEQAAQVKTLGQMFTDSERYRDRKQYGRSPFAVDMDGSTVKTLRASRLGMDALADPAAVKTLMTTSAGLAPYPPRLPDIVPFPVLTPVVADLIPQQDTDAPSIIYLELTTWTRNAAGVAEGGTKPEDALAGTQRIVPMAKIATTLPVTEEQMDDLPGIRDFIDSALRTSVLLEEDRQLLKGAGSGSNEMTGFYNKSGVNSGSKGSDDVFTAARKMLTQVRTVGFANPTGYVMHATDWETFSTQKDTTGRFILGDPGQQTEKRLWGLPVVETIEATQGTLLTGDFQTWSRLYRKMGLRVDAGWVSTQFLTNAVTLRAEMRECLVIQRGSAFAIRSGF